MHLKAPTSRRSFNLNLKTNTSSRSQIPPRFHTSTSRPSTSSSSTSSSTSNPHLSAPRPRTLTGTTPRAPTKVTLDLIHILPALPLPRAQLARPSRATLLTNL